MKKLLSILLLMTTAIALVNCGDDDDKKDKKLTGSWEVVDASGTEWEEGEGVINVIDPDNEFIGETFTFTATEVTLGSFGTFDYTFSNNVLTIDFDGETESFVVLFDGADNMEWAQEEPDEHEDYSYNEGGDNYLYYQKFFSLERD